MWPWLRSQCRGQRGQALVEFAVILPPLVMLVLGAAGIGEVLRAQLTVDAAAQEAALVAAAVRPADGGDYSAAGRAGERADATARSVLDQRGLAGSSADVEVTGDFSRGEPGNPAIIAVYVRYRYQIGLASRPILRLWFPDGTADIQGVAREAIPRYSSVWP